MAQESSPEIESLPAVLDREPQPPTDLIFDDGEPLETNRHRIAMNVLIDSALIALHPRSDFFAGGNMFVYYSVDQAMNRDFRGPDFFVALDVDGTRTRKAWITWEENGRYPDVIVELMSPSTERVDRAEKKALYERIFRTADYILYDPFDPASLEGWHLNSAQQYELLTKDDRGWLWSTKLQLWFGLWEGQLRREPATGTCHWLRLYYPSGELVPLQEEIAQAQQQIAEQERERAEQERERAEQERQRAERLADRLRQLGEDPDRL